MILFIKYYNYYLKIAVIITLLVGTELFSSIFSYQTLQYLSHFVLLKECIPIIVTEDNFHFVAKDWPNFNTIIPEKFFDLGSENIKNILT